MGSSPTGGTNIMLNRILLSVILIISLNTFALANSKLEQLENDVIEYCEELEDNRDRFYVNDVAECIYYIQQTYRVRAYIKFLRFHKRYKEVIKEEKERIERLERLLGYWISED